jgi:hypothetical protein
LSDDWWRERKTKTCFGPVTLKLAIAFGDYLAAQHFLNFRPLPHGQGSLRPTLPGAVRGPGAGSCSRDAILASGARLCRKKRFKPAQR